MKKIIIILIFSALSISAGLKSGASGQQFDTTSKIKAVFIYNFTKYIEWPSDYQSGEFVVGILGSNEGLMSELKKMSQTKKVANQSFAIRQFGSSNDIDKCHILYIPNSKLGEFSGALQKLNGKSTLIVTEKPGLAKQGSAINFVVVNNRQKIELNKSNVESHNLKVSKSLEDLAVLVN